MSETTCISVYVQVLPCPRFHFHPLYVKYKTSHLLDGCYVTVVLTLSSSACPNCICDLSSKRSSQMPADERSRGGTIKDRKEDTTVSLRISALSIKIEWGPNIFTLKVNPRGLPFKTRAGRSRGISWCRPAEVTIVVYLSGDE